jgi:hypothetical protein
MNVKTILKVVKPPPQAGVRSPLRQIANCWQRMCTMKVKESTYVSF